MSFPKVSFEESLGKNVVETGKCVGYGTCILVCPFNCLEYKEGKPALVKECKVCGICPQACPKMNGHSPRLKTSCLAEKGNPMKSSESIVNF